MADSDSCAKTRTTYMQRACLNCRRRKIRCDAERPACKQCRLRPPRHGKPCRYSHAPPDDGAYPQREALYDFDSHCDEGLIFLTDPYQPTPLQPYTPDELSPLSMLPNSIDYTPDSSPLSTSPLSIEQQYTPDSLNPVLLRENTQRHGSTTITNHTPTADKAFLEVFLSRFAHHPLFFFDPSDFRRFVSLSLSSRGRSHFSQGLLYVLHLWAHRFSPPAANDSGKVLLSLAGHHLPSDIIKNAAGVQHLHQTLQLVQATILLSLYYLDAGRSAEGRYYCAAATSLAFTAGLHRLGSPLAWKPFPAFAFDEDVLSLPADATRIIEMVDAFWSVLLLNNYWVAVSGLPSCIAPDTVITTPRPTASPTPSSDPADGHPTRSQLIEASMLHERTVSFVSNDHTNAPNPHHHNSAHAEFWDLDQHLHVLAGTLGRPPPASDQREHEMAVMAHALVNAAIVRLHAPHLHRHRGPSSASNADPRASHAHAKCLAAAQTLLDSVNLATSLDHADPVLGPLLACVADVYLHLSQQPDASASAAAANLSRTLALLEGIAVKSPLARGCLMRYELARRVS